VKRLTLMHVPSDNMGYGRLGVRLAKALTARGVELYTEVGEPANDMTGQVASSGVRPDRPTTAVCWVSGPSHANGWWDGQRPFVFTMWEGSRLPEAYRENLHEFEKIIVPSEHNVELFGQFHDNVELCLLGVDPDVWHYQPRPEVRETFRFLIGGSGARKGTDLAFKAFRTVFGDQFRPDPNDQIVWTGKGPEPRLVMKNPRAEDFYAPWVDMISGRISAVAEVDLYASCHVYLQPSRGEGFGLQPLQAIAQGLPTVLTDAHGHASFAHLGIPLGYTMSKAEYFIYGDAGEWWEPNLDDLCEAMYDTYTNYEPARVRAEQSARTVAETFTWDHTAARLEEILGDSLEAPYTGGFTSYTDSSQWIEPQSKLYHVRVNRQHGPVFMPAGEFVWYPGRDYYETSDVKRVLFERGALDPACLDAYAVGEASGIMDSGMNADLVAELSGRNEHCPTCSQQLNTRPTKTDAIYEELSAHVPA